MKGYFMLTLTSNPIFEALSHVSHTPPFKPRTVPDFAMTFPHGNLHGTPKPIVSTAEDSSESPDSDFSQPTPPEAEPRQESDRMTGGVRTECYGNPTSFGRKWLEKNVAWGMLGVLWCWTIFWWMNVVFFWHVLCFGGLINGGPAPGPPSSYDWALGACHQIHQGCSQHNLVRIPKWTFLAIHSRPSKCL